MTPSTSIEAAPGYKRIATEEAFAIPEMFGLYRKLLDKRQFDDPGFESLWGFYLRSPSERATAIIERLQWLDERRIADMDATGIAQQILSLTSPGVQIFDAPTANAMATESNDQVAQYVRRHPSRFAALAAFAPQDPQAGARELERGVQKLGFRGGILNSHTHHEYFDNPKFWTIFEAAEALGVPIYLHPNSPSKGLIQPLVEAGLDGAVYGFGVETGLHLLRIITSGAFDRFPKLQIIVGHLGEALPFWLFRLDYMHRATVVSKRYACLKPLKKQISDYMRENVCVTTSGMAWAPAITFCQQVLGVERVLYAMDYPYEFVADEVRAQDNLPISAADKKQFFQTNAERVFSL